ncbi:MAG: thiol-disulfide oxidoreductase DCC family protein, partial [Pyrinomonadaceae bacterium]
LESSVSIIWVERDAESTGEDVLVKSDAIFHIFDYLDGYWKWLRLFRFLPRGILDYLYDLIAGSRYRIFGKYDACPVPDVSDRARFLEI